MATRDDLPQAKFGIGDLIAHRLFGYRGVVVDVDPEFGLTDAWYETMARSRPPRDQPWYQVLVDAADHTTYVAERNLAADHSGEPIEHPLLAVFFARFENGRYRPGRRDN